MPTRWGGVPSEAAALGLVATLVLTIMMRQLSWWLLVDSLHGAVRVTCIVITILVAATFMSSAMGYLHVPQQIAQAMAALDVGPFALIALVGAFYLLLGLFLEGLSILVTSLPITLPLVVAAGFDPIWFGVFLVITVELAQVTPAIGFQLFVLQELTGESIGRIALAALPFFLLPLTTAVIIRSSRTSRSCCPRAVRPVSCAGSTRAQQTRRI